MSFIARNGAYGFPTTGATIHIYDQGTTTHATGLVDLDGNALSSPFFLPADTFWGFTPSDFAEYDVLWEDVTKYLVQKGVFKDAVIGTDVQAYSSNLDTVNQDMASTDDVLFNSSKGKFFDLATGLAAPARVEGRVFYDDERKCLGFYIDETEFTWQIGREFPMRVYNDTGDTLTNGRAARVVNVGTGGGTYVLPYIDYATADFSNGVARNTIGIITHDIEAGTFGEVTILGW
ncbi:MAG: hypothetical protein JRC86_09655, partial [Deltaproteobacteria bacterium]|nr:hypothetical protein [Deltaproteobacteria bacterium]